MTPTPQRPIIAAVMPRTALLRALRRPLAALLAACALVAPGLALARVETLQVTEPAAAGGTEGIAVFFSDEGAPVNILVPIPANSTAEGKRKIIIEALNARGIGALPEPGNRIKVEGVHDIKWRSGTGELGDAMTGTNALSMEFGLQLAPGFGGPTGQDPSGNASLFAVEFAGPGFHAQGQVMADALRGGFDIDSLLLVLFQDLLADLADPVKPGLYLDLAQDLIGFDAAALGMSAMDGEWLLLGGSNDTGIDASIRMRTVPEPATALLALWGLAMLIARRPLRRPGAMARH